MNHKSCPSPERLSQAFSVGASAQVQQHLSACAECTRQWNALVILSQSARQLPWYPPDEARLQRLTANVLGAVQQARRQHRPTLPRQRWGLMAAAGIVLLLGLSLWGLERRLLWRGQPQLHGTIQALQKARFTHHGPPQDEVVALAEGTVLVEVSPLRAGERFRVIVGRSEVEVRGTAFEVTAQGDQLQHVHVLHGRVEVHPSQEAAAVMLGGGEDWPAQKPLASDQEAHGGAPLLSPHSSAASAAPGQPAAASIPPAATQRLEPRAPVARPAVAHALSTPADRAFRDGWRALRKAEYLHAAESFQRATQSAAGQTLAEDAWFWHGIAWARAGRQANAVRAMQEFLQRYPGSPRYGEASCILGWLLVDAGEFDEAAHHFQPAARDKAPDVRESAQAGLVACERGAARKR